MATRDSNLEETIKDIRQRIYKLRAELKGGYFDPPAVLEKPVVKQIHNEDKSIEDERAKRSAEMNDIKAKLLKSKKN